MGYKMHRQDLLSLVKPLQQLGIECVLATPGSAYSDLWPTVDLKCLLPKQVAAA